MKKIYTTCFIFCLALFCTQKISAQVSGYNFTAVQETYQPINGTIVTSFFEDDVFHPNLPIGFSFVYNGNTTNKFGICTNGFITMDSLNHSALWLPNSNSLKSICPFMHDLMNTNTGGSIQYVTAGTAPNRMLIVQWYDFGAFAVSGNHFNFQIILFETTNCIKFSYGYCHNQTQSQDRCYVGLIGNTISDFNLRTSSVNDWTNTFPSPSYISNWLTINSTSTLPTGLAYYFGNCSPSVLPFAYLTGNVYDDVNNNGAKDAGEAGLQSFIIQETIYNYFATTDTSGNYAMYFPDSTQTYHLTVSPWAYWSVSSLPTSYTVTPQSQPCNNLDFGLYAIPNVHDMQITGMSSHQCHPDGNSYIYATYHNIGTVIENGSVQYIKNSHFSFVSSTPAPTSVSGDTMTWNYSNFQIFEYRNIALQIHTDLLVTLGDTLQNTWIVNPVITDTVPSDNYFDDYRVVTTSFDPNSKSVSPEGDILNGTTLHYTIHFQNTGTASAVNVTILDTLDTNLDRSSFMVEGYSHPLTFFNMTGSGDLRFVFQNINLPDSNSNEPASHGYLQYRINPLPGLPGGANLQNTANIIFDYNVPVVTNTTSTHIVEIITSDGNNFGAVNSSLLVYPNPLSQSAALKFETQAGKNNSIEIISPEGKLIRSLENISSGKIVIDRKNLPAGIYFVRLRSGKEVVATGKLVVE